MIDVISKLKSEIQAIMQLETDIKKQRQTLEVIFNQTLEDTLQKIETTDISVIKVNAAEAVADEDNTAAQTDIE